MLNTEQINSCHLVALVTAFDVIMVPYVVGVRLTYRPDVVCVNVLLEILRCHRIDQSTRRGAGSVHIIIAELTMCVNGSVTVVNRHYEFHKFHVNTRFESQYETCVCNLSNSASNEINQDCHPRQRPI